MEYTQQASKPDWYQSDDWFPDLDHSEIYLNEVWHWIMGAWRHPRKGYGPPKPIFCIRCGNNLVSKDTDNAYDSCKRTNCNLIKNSTITIYFLCVIYFISIFSHLRLIVGFLLLLLIFGSIWPMVYTGFILPLVIFWHVRRQKIIQN